MYIFKESIFILNIVIYNINYMNICLHVNSFKIYNVWVCIHIYIINIHRTHTYIM